MTNKCGVHVVLIFSCFDDETFTTNAHKLTVYVSRLCGRTSLCQIQFCIEHGFAQHSQRLLLLLLLLWRLWMIRLSVFSYIEFPNFKTAFVFVVCLLDTTARLILHKYQRSTAYKNVDVSEANKKLLTSAISCAVLCCAVCSIRCKHIDISYPNNSAEQNWTQLNWTELNEKKKKKMPSARFHK